MEVSTSILSVKPEEAVHTFYDIEVAKSDYFHIDVMDGKFVKPDTKLFMKESIQTIKNISNIPIDVHLMVENADFFVNEYLPYMPAYITVHYESFKSKNQLLKVIDKIKENGSKVGISIKPETEIEAIKEFLPIINLVLVMSVEPGYGGQKFKEETLYKIKKLNEYREEVNLDYYIEVDGGINLEIARKVETAGGDIIVVGSAIIESKDKKELMKKLKNI